MTRTLPLLGSLLIALVCSPAMAKGDPARAKEASRAFAEASALYKQSRYVNAIAAFERAYELRPHFMVQCSIARCYENLSDVVKAAGYYQRCLDEGAAKAKMGDKVRASLKAAEARITWLKVTSPGKGGVLFVDGDNVGTAPGRVPLNPGKHAVEVRREGARPDRTSVQTLGGEQLNVTLTPLELRIRAQPEATKPVPSEPPRRRLPQYWFWGAAGATVVLAVVGTVLGVQTLGLRSDYEEDPTEGGYNDFVGRRLATNLVWAATALAAGGSTLLFFYTDFGWMKKETAAVGAPGSDVALGLGLRGTF